ncbi:LexA family protein [Brucella pituitosa]
MITLTKRQKDAYDFIKSYASTNGYGPSYEEISTGLGLASKSSVHRLVYGLVDRGLIIKHQGVARGYSFPQQEGRAA